MSSGADSIGHAAGGHVPPLLQMAGHGATASIEEQQTKKLAKLY